MSRGKVRRNEYFAMATSLLREAGLTWREVCGGKHGKLMVDVDGVEHLVTLSGSASDRRGIVNFEHQLMRRIRQWKAETDTLASAPVPAQFPTLEKETVVDTTFDIALHEVDGEPRVLDIDLADRLGFSRPSSIRVLIERNRSEIERFGPLHRSDAKSSGGRPSAPFMLTEEQALTVGALSNAERAADVRYMLIKVFVAWRRGHMQPASDLDRAVGMLKSLVRDMAQHRRITDEHGRAILAIEEALTSPGAAPLVPAFDFAGSVTALEIITLAGVKPDQRVRGTSAAVTLRMKDFCLSHGYTALQTPAAIDASSRWRFPREAAQQWLYGENQGAECIHSHVRARRGEATPDMFAVIKGGRR